MNEIFQWTIQDIKFVKTFNQPFNTLLQSTIHVCLNLKVSDQNWPKFYLILQRTLILSN